MSTILIVSIIVIFFVCLIVWDENKQEKQSDKVLRDAIAKYAPIPTEEQVPEPKPQTVPVSELMEHTIEGIEKVLRATGANIEHSGQIDENTHRWTVCYAGGYFIVEYEEGTAMARLYYYNFFEFKMADEENILRAIADINAKYMVWRCYPRQYKADGSREKVGNVCLSQLLFLNGTRGAIVDDIRFIFNAAFEINREFHEQYEKIAQSHCDFSFRNNEIDVYNQLARMRIEQEEKLIHNIEQENTSCLGRPNLICPHKLTIENIFLLYEPIAWWGLACKMRVIQGTECTQITDLPTIMQFDVMDYLRQQVGAVERLLIAVDFWTKTLLLNIHKLDFSTEDTWYYQLVINGAGPEILSTPLPDELTIYHASQFTFMVGINDLDNPWEAQYNVEEAMDKMSSGRINELNDKQRMLIAYNGELTKKLAMQHYWALKYYNSGCYYQSLCYFSSMLASMKQHWSELNKEWQQCYSEINYHIGHIYMRMGDYERAFFYLNIARDANSIIAYRDFVMCLCYLKEPAGSVSYISHLRDQIIDMLKSQDEPEDKLVDFYHFLNRQLAYMLIETGDLDNAESMLHHMIEQEIDVEYAQKELEYLQQKKEQKNHNQ